MTKYTQELNQLSPRGYSRRIFGSNSINIDQTSHFLILFYQINWIGAKSHSCIVRHFLTNYYERCDAKNPLTKPFFHSIFFMSFFFFISLNVIWKADLAVYFCCFIFTICRIAFAYTILVNQFWLCFFFSFWFDSIWYLVFALRVLDIPNCRTAIVIHFMCVNIFGKRIHAIQSKLTNDIVAMNMMARTM